MYISDDVIFIITIGSWTPSLQEHNKFQTFASVPFAPLLISAWSTALANVDVDPSCVDVHYQLPTDWKYVFPEPGIFLGANPI